MRQLCDNCKKEYDASYGENPEWGEETPADSKERLCPDCKESFNQLP